MTDRSILYVFLAIDAAFIVLHILYSRTNSGFDLSMDRGYAEIYEYGKTCLAILLLGSLTIRKRSLLYLSWTVVFLYILLDNSFLIHERVGRVASEELNLSGWAGLRALDFGELGVWAFFGLFLLTGVAIAYYFSRDHLAKTWSRYLLVALIALVLTGVVLDMAHQMAEGIGSLSELIGVVEDGGELVAASVAVWLVLVLGRRIFSQSAARA